MRIREYLKTGEMGQDWAYIYEDKSVNTKNRWFILSIIYDVADKV